MNIDQRIKDYKIFEVEIDMMMNEDLPQLLKESKNYSNVKVKYDLDSVNQIESFYIDIMQGVEGVSISQARLDRIFIAYIGEAVINNAGGHWELCEDSKNRNFGAPRIVQWGTDKSNNPLSPVGLRERIKEDLKHGVLSQLIRFCSNKEEFMGEFFKDFKEEK
jgi:hypothetical protein